MLQFKVDEEKCTRCGICAKDCPVNVIDMVAGSPVIPAEKERHCIKCQHCLAVCPTGAISILGVDPAQSQPLSLHSFPEPDHLETLIKGRRSIRFYRDENLDPKLMQRLLDVAWHAPTGINARQVLFTVIDDKDTLAAFFKKARAQG